VALGPANAHGDGGFIAKLRIATSAQRFQISTDGFGPYVNAICDGLGDRVDLAQLVKTYVNNNSREGQQRYSPAEVVGALPKPIMGNPLAEKICTSHVERQNGSMRQWIKRLTRLSYAFSKKWGNLNAALGLHFAYYNLCRIHRTLRVTPAMEAGITDRAWELSDLLRVG
jgi:hypothetical protein